MKYIENGTITSPKGFEAASTAAGIRNRGREDMALIFSKTPCTAAGTFTRNIVKAAPVVYDRAVIDGDGCVHAVVINSGIANACTGREGMDYCKKTAAEAGVALGIEADEVLVASTGVIGMQLPMDKISAGVRELSGGLSDSEAAGEAAAKAIMTTDTRHKQIAVSFELGGKTVTIGGICKGSGMIHPDMCTMLAFVTTDADISKEMLTRAVKEDVKDTFNMVSVDGDTSTNDTFVVLANGEAGNDKITGEGEAFDLFCEALKEVNTFLAKQIAGDGEGATALFEVRVVNAVDKEQAVLLAKSIITSSLTKAAIFGHDANWGRILCAMGYSGAKFDPDDVELSFISAAGSILIFKDGVAADYSEEEATKILSEPEVTVLADMKSGAACATAWGCDLTYDYVKINADYRS